MEISLPDEGVYGIVDHAQFEPPNPGIDPYKDFKGFSKIRVRVLNTTPSIVTPDGTTVTQSIKGGTVLGVLKFRRNLCYRPALDGEITAAAQMPVCRAADEEIVVSNPDPVVKDIPAADQSPNGVELNLAFPNALPINAVDIVLQVVYRGPLGTESDAVVVATRDISEPTFITAYNDTDRVFIGGRCYDPAIVANTDSLWNQLTAACKPSSGALRYVTSACANIPLNVRFSMGAANAVAVVMEKSGAVDQRVLPRRFARFAVLGDPSAPTSMVLGFNNAPLSLASGTPTQSQYTGRRAQQQTLATLVKNTADAGYHYQVDTSTVVDSYIAHRGVKTWRGQSFVVDGTTGAVGTPCPDADLDALVNNERYPLPATIIGWN
jgi:hypothetical protein